MREYATQYNVSQAVESYVSDIFNYTIDPDTYDYIVAVSSLEHVHSENALDRVLLAMVDGTKSQGINCIVANTNVQEFHIYNGTELEPLVEVNLSIEQMKMKLNDVYHGWEVLSETVKRLSFQINRGHKSVLLKTNAVTYVARKTSSLFLS